MIQLLANEVGYQEKSNGYTKFGDWYSQNVDTDPAFKTAAWCDMFLAWAARETGVEEYIGEFAFTPWHAAWFKKQDAWGDRPEPGALVFYDWSGGNDVDDVDHVGIVVKVVGDKIHTIEGNIDGGQAKRKVRDESRVAGYGYPAKIKERKAAEETTLTEADTPPPAGLEARLLSTASEPEPAQPLTPPIHPVSTVPAVYQSAQTLSVAGQAGATEPAPAAAAGRVATTSAPPQPERPQEPLPLKALTQVSHPAGPEAGSPFAPSVDSPVEPTALLLSAAVAIAYLTTRTRLPIPAVPGVFAAARGRHRRSAVNRRSR
ncbi:CHAP domain-containing protein [Rhizohabitans arisaemae]|uniref:CHAP domain-containing protein n=1 Tax=Rhizohabitans arisaemae TaxID=2720610 RepID=UPI0024B211C3|nr:CHAP domain-containing protein [Rhizohabitans arisaemae]